MDRGKGGWIQKEKKSGYRRRKLSDVQKENNNKDRKREKVIFVCKHQSLNQENLFFFFLSHMWCVVCMYVNDRESAMDREMERESKNNREEKWSEKRSDREKSGEVERK